MKVMVLSSVHTS